MPHSDYLSVIMLGFLMYYLSSLSVFCRSIIQVNSGYHVLYDADHSRSHGPINQSKQLEKKSFIITFVPLQPYKLMKSLTVIQFLSKETPKETQLYKKKAKETLCMH